ncbi:MAG TPA: hypothetical protein VMY37_29825 [Thermoguttaceae bacterium]|nr:hypothetical protein [Thermoguttaceae bacterium]
MTILRPWRLAALVLLAGWSVGCSGTDSSGSGGGSPGAEAAPEAETPEAPSPSGKSRFLAMRRSALEGKLPDDRPRTGQPDTPDTTGQPRPAEDAAAPAPPGPPRAGAEEAKEVGPSAAAPQPEAAPAVEPPGEPAPTEGPAPGDASGEEPPKMVDLLKVIDPARHGLRGQWTSEGSDLISPKESLATLFIPYDVPREYRLTVAAERISGSAGLNLGLVVGGRQTMVVLEGYGKKWNGLSLVDGVGADRNETRRQGIVFREGEPCTIVCSVRRLGVRVTCDGETIIDWTGDPERLSLDKRYWPNVPQNRLAVGTWAGVVLRISKLEIEPLGGRSTPASVVRGPGASGRSRRRAGPLRPPVPDAEARAEAEKLFEEVYGEQREAAKTAEERLALARKLLGEAAKIRNEPAGYFVLLRNAQQVAAEAADAQTALEAADRMTRAFEIDPMETKVQCLSAVAEAAKLATQRRPLAKEAFSLVDAAVEEENLEAAIRLGDIARKAAQGAREYKLVKEITARMEEIEEAKGATALYEKAVARLEEEPTNAAANLAAGRHVCFVQGDWERGIPMLALGSDAELKALAVKELEAPASIDAQVALGDGWWDLAETREDREKASLLLRAGYWYGQVRVRPITGLVKSKVEQRMAEIAKLGEPLPKPGVPSSPARTPPFSTGPQAR